MYPLRIQFLAVLWLNSPRTASWFTPESRWRRITAFSEEERRRRDRVTEKKKNKKRNTQREPAQGRRARIYICLGTRIRASTLTHVWNATCRHTTPTTRGAAGRLARRGSWRQSVGSPGTLLSRFYEAHRIYESSPSSFSPRPASHFLAPCRRCGMLSNYIFVASRFKFLESQTLEVSLSLDPSLHNLAYCKLLLRISFFSIFFTLIIFHLTRF